MIGDLGPMPEPQAIPVCPHCRRVRPCDHDEPVERCPKCGTGQLDTHAGHYPSVGDYEVVRCDTCDHEEPR